MLNLFVVTVLQVVMLVGIGVVLAGIVSPITWKFPNYDKQVVINKVAGILATVCAVALGLGKWIGNGL